MKSLGLINYEGDCLAAHKVAGAIFIKDQYGEIVNNPTSRKKLHENEFTPEELFEFADGLFNIVDSKGKSWNYTKEAKDAKPSYSMLYNFVKNN